MPIRDILLIGVCSHLSPAFNCAEIDCTAIIMKAETGYSEPWSNKLGQQRRRSLTELTARRGSSSLLGFLVILRKTLVPELHLLHRRPITASCPDKADFRC